MALYHVRRNNMIVVIESISIVQHLVDIGSTEAVGGKVILGQGSLQILFIVLYQLIPA